MTPTKKASVPKVCVFFIFLHLFINIICLFIQHYVNLQVGMSFDNVESAEEFYKSYARAIGFDVRIGQQKLDDNGLVQWKRYLCARQGYKQKKDDVPVDPSKKNALEKLDVDVKPIFMLSAIVKASTRYQLYMRTITMTS